MLGIVLQEQLTVISQELPTHFMEPVNVLPRTTLLK
jgi:hypothetical protein